MCKIENERAVQDAKAHFVQLWSRAFEALQSLELNKKLAREPMPDVFKSPQFRTATGRVRADELCGKP
eukprot:SAG31_NODE_34559_length_331_cov_1.625000_1_plen_67_part_01